ncbi:MAG: XdhC family protein [Spirochaetaceae bacterium]|nr:XdhC family protein [Spirochaetaceae bacterium]
MNEMSFYSNGTIPKQGFLLTGIAKDNLGEHRFLSSERDFPENVSDFFVEKISTKPRMVICGGGHVARPLAKMASMAAFSVVVIDNRAEFACKEFFPTADEIICGEFDRVLKDFSYQPNDFFVIVTSGHSADRICLREILLHPCAYVGMIGSKRKNFIIFQHLLNEGFSQEKLDEVCAPIGLAIKAETPAEIAVSILGETILRRREIGDVTVLDEDFFRAVNSGDKLVLATVLDAEGSTPAKLGGRMVISAAGVIYGTVGGGSAEYEIICHGQKMIENPTLSDAEIHWVKMTNSDAENQGMICGGSVKVLLEFV